MCDFPVITRFGVCSLCDNGIRSRSVSFHFGWCILSCFPWGGKGSLIVCGWGCYPWGQKTTCKRGPIWRVLPTAHGAKRLHTRENNIMRVVNRWIPWPVYVIVWYICDKLPYVRFYDFGIILLVLTDYSI